MKLRSGTIVGYRPPIELNKSPKLQIKEPQGIKTTAIKKDRLPTYPPIKIGTASRYAQVYIGSPLSGAILPTILERDLDENLKD